MCCVHFLPLSWLLTSVKEVIGDETKFGGLCRNGALMNQLGNDQLNVGPLGYADRGRHAPAQHLPVVVTIRIAPNPQRIGGTAL
mmetsp:Transcript_28443/g.66748  ORF Transcript_28443/g.66748 Transcript_28443/m.66748 type:complete len:84 (+) Transcript_28443:24-275(+)